MASPNENVLFTAATTSHKSTKATSETTEDPLARMLAAHINRCKIYTSLSLLVGMACCLCYDSPELHPKLNGLIIALGFYCVVNCVHYLSVLRCVTTRRAEVMEQLRIVTHHNGSQ